MKYEACVICILSLITALPFSACKKHLSTSQNPDNLKDLFKREKSCKLLGGERYDSIKYTGGWNAAYAYDFVFPKAFMDSTIDVLDKEGALISDTSYFSSPDKQAKIRMWVGKIVPFPLGTIGVKLSAKDFMRADSAAAAVVSQMKEGKYPYFKNAKIDNICYGYTGYSQRIILQGHTGAKNFVCKTDIGELPVSGDLIEKNIVFEYNSKSEKYRKTAITVIDEFNGIR